MDGDEIIERWQVMSEEVISGMTEWRKQNPKATFREIEEEGTNGWQACEFG